MLRLHTVVEDYFSSLLEEYFCEIGECRWAIEKLRDDTPTVLSGYFDDVESAKEAYAQLRGHFEALPENFEIEEVDDYDWQNKYKEFLTAWNHKGLHWVPLWMREDYQYPAGDKVLYFDAGLAFGTGDHPTTRLCAIAMADYAASHADFAKKSVIDAGCGSGILALSARLFGFENVYGFDRDDEAVRVSIENAKTNKIDGALFEHSGIERALSDRKADVLLANIQADVLCIYAENLLAAVNLGGKLVLSGILAAENEEVKKYFENLAGDNFSSAEQNFMGEWSSLVMERLQ